MHGHWIWYELLSHEPARAKAFYEAVAGWHITPGQTPPLHYGMIAGADGTALGGLLPITAEMAASGARPGWVGYLAVEDVDQAIIEVCARGGAVLMPAMDIPQGRLALLRDSCGAPFYVMRPVMPEGGAGGASPACGWNELCASAPAEAIAFYCDLFGWSEAGAMDLGAMGAYRFLAREGIAFGAVVGLMPGHTQSHWNHYLRVDGIDAAAAAIAPHGGTLLMGPMQVPGGDWILHGRDAEGGHFCLVSPRR